MTSGSVNSSTEEESEQSTKKNSGSESFGTEPRNEQRQQSRGQNSYHGENPSFGSVEKLDTMSFSFSSAPGIGVAKHGFVYEQPAGISKPLSISASIPLVAASEQQKKLPPSPMVTPPPRDRQDSLKSVDESIVSNDAKPQASMSCDSPGKQGGVPHIYHDYSRMPDDSGYVRKKTGGVTQPFPEKLHEMLSSVDLDESERSIVAWLPHGRAFIVRIPKQFTATIMPKYFKQTKLTSFQRQLNLYGFRRITQGPDSGAYYHELFLKGRPGLCQRMSRQKVKGTGHKQPADAKTEPNFYLMSPVSETSSDNYTSSNAEGPTESTFASQPLHKSSDTAAAEQASVAHSSALGAHGISNMQSKVQEFLPRMVQSNFSKFQEYSNITSNQAQVPLGTPTTSPANTTRQTFNPSAFPTMYNDDDKYRSGWMEQDPNDLPVSPGLRNAAFLLRGIATSSARLNDDVARLGIPTEEQQGNNHNSSDGPIEEWTEAMSASSEASSGVWNYDGSNHRLLQPRFSDFEKQND